LDRFLRKKYRRSINPRDIIRISGKINLRRIDFIKI